METPRIEDKKVQQLVCDQDNEVGDLEIGNTLEEAASQEDEERMNSDQDTERNQDGQTVRQRKRQIDG